MSLTTIIVIALVTIMGRFLFWYFASSPGMDPFSQEYIDLLYSQCENFDPNTIEKNRLYVPEDAVCFIKKRLGEKYSIEVINEFITLEFEYMKSIGLVGSGGNSGKQVDHQEMSEFILKRSRYGTTQNAIDDIVGVLTTLG